MNRMFVFSEKSDSEAFRALLKIRSIRNVAPNRRLVLDVNGIEPFHSQQSLIKGIAISGKAIELLGSDNLPFAVYRYDVVMSEFKYMSPRSDFDVANNALRALVLYASSFNIIDSI